MKTYGYLLNKFFLIVILSLSFAKDSISSVPGDYFRTVANVNSLWDLTTTWESSVNGSTGWTAATLAPTSAAAGITIRTGATVALIPLVTYTANKLTIQSGGTLNHTVAATLRLANAAGADFVINGTYVLYGTQPDLTTNGATCQVSATGLVRVDDNVLGIGSSDDFGYNNRVTFGTDAVFQWNTTTRFDAVNRQYFVNSPAGTSPIFRVTQNLTGANYIGNTPGNDFVSFNGRFEVSTGLTVEFGGNGPKVFRDGIGGAGTLVHQLANANHGNCGLFQITGTAATIYGTVTINIEGVGPTTDFEVSGTATITGTPVINIGTASTPVNGTLVVSGTLTNNSANPVDLSYGNLNITNTVGGTGTFKASGTRTVVTVAKTTTGTAGSLRFTPGFNTVYDFVMGLATPLSSATSRIELGNSFNIAHNLTLTRGIIVTGANLLTWTRTAVGATLSNPTPTNSFIATCNADGSALNYSLSSPYNGAAGFRINNVGAANTFFPVGATFLNSGSGFIATPNRMMINNAGTVDNFTVVVKKELLIYTPLSGVNRVWYVSEGTTGGSNVTMNLYFTKRDWNNNAYPAVQDEIETGFIYSDPHLIQKSYDADDNEFVSNSLIGVPVGAGGGDVPSYIATANNTEIFAQYRNGVSPDLSGNKNGIKQFGRFSVFNAASVVLPVSITNIKAYQKGAEVLVEWQALNELSVDRYEIEKSADAVNFNTVVTVTARNNGNTINSYISTDIKPAQGKNFYRIKAIDKDGKVTYTQILSVDISNGRRFISVIPNPVRNRAINLQLNNLNAGKYNIILYSIEGKAVYRTLTEHGGGSSTQQIALPANVSGGAYILKVFNERDNYTERILVQ